MNATHIHLLLNHFPIIGTSIGSAILLYSIIKNQNAGKLTSSISSLMWTATVNLPTENND